MESNQLLRNPFTLTRQPTISRFQLWAFNPAGVDILSKLRRFIGKKLYSGLAKMNRFLSTGEFQYEREEKKIPIRFRGTNTQFVALNRTVFKYGYEIETAMTLDILAKGDGVFYDIGSNWGYFSLYLASKSDYAGKIFAFEPVGSTYADLVSIIDQARETERIMPLQIALSDYDGEAHMEFPDDIHSGLALLTKQKSARAVVTIARKIDSLDIAPPSFMKIDVEGSEPEVVKGGIETIKKFQPSIVFENFLYDPSRTYAVFVLLSDLGYRMYIPALEFRTSTYTYRLSCGNNYADGIEHDGSFRYTLVPFSMENRFLMQPHLNILAVHSRRIAGISSHIAPSKLATPHYARRKR